LLSIILISFNRPSTLHQSLAALANQFSPTEMEVLVIGRFPEKVYQPQNTTTTDENNTQKNSPNSRHSLQKNISALQQQFPQFRWLPAEPTATIPEQRSLGIHQSRGELVALLEDDCLVGPDWGQNIFAAHRQNPNTIAIGGPILPGRYQKPLDWAVFFCEYGRFLPPFSGPVPHLPGNNISYKRTALLDHFNPDDGFYDVFIHQQLQQTGQPLLADEKLAVTHITTWSGKHLLAVPYHHGRTFAGMRLQGRPFPRRLLYAMLSPLLPWLLTGRLARELFGRKAYRASFLQSLPWIVVFYGSWSLGEVAGAMFGAGGSSGRWQ
jgi:GT2 family glycosyltransferase